MFKEFRMRHERRGLAEPPLEFMHVSNFLGFGLFCGDWGRFFSDRNGFRSLFRARPVLAGPIIIEARESFGLVDFRT